MVWAFYGLNSAGADFWNHLADCMQHLGFLPYPVDLDLWTKPIVRPEDEFDYYAYLLIYVDFVMLIHHDAESLIWRIDRYLS